MICLMTVYLKKDEKKESSINLKLQQAEIIDKKFYENAYANIENDGILWFFPSSIMHKPKHNLRNRWIDFF